jgi:hypothetical protein
MAEEKLQNKQRSIDDGYWCWANKGTLRYLRGELHARRIKHTSSYLAIYHALTEIASDERGDTFFCTQREIAKRAGCATSTSNKALSILEEIGVIEIVRSNVKQKGCKIPYHLTPPNKYILVNPVRTFAIAGGISDNVKKAIPGSAKLVDPDDAKLADLYMNNKKEIKRKNKINGIKEIERNYLQPEYSESFNQLWEAYPKKISKGAAWEVFKPINPSDELLAQMLETIRISTTTSNWRKDKMRWVPHLKNWLKNSGWEDQPIEEELDNNETYRPRGGW